MRAWSAPRPGDPRVLTILDHDLPSCGPNELLVRVETVGLNFSDLLMIADNYQLKPGYPFTPGQELAGTVVDAGPSVDVALGTRIASKVLWGAAAPYVVVRADMAIELPDDVSFAEGAALPVVYPTAHIGLFDRGRAQAGETILVHAAAGALGLAVVQLAKAHGLRVIATAGGAEKLDIARRFGADLAIDYREEGWWQRVQDVTDHQGVDLVFDSVGGEVTMRSLQVIAHGARLLVAGFSSGEIAKIPANRLLLKSASAVGVYWNHDRAEDRAVLDTALRDVLALKTAGSLELVVGRSYPFAALPDALDALASRQTHGKIALTLPSDKAVDATDRLDRK